jgi:hypothetical protein
MPDCSPNTNRFFGSVQQHIKFYQGSLVAVEGPHMTHKMSSLPSLRIPFQQVMSSRIVLRAGQTDYLLNHLGLGDNVTFLAITAKYDEKSKFESDNYVQYSYYSDKNRLFNFSNLLVLTGNSENRIEQLYLHNPNENMPVVLEVMVAIIDEFYDYFTEHEPENTPEPIFRNLLSSNISLWNEDQNTLVVKNSEGDPILYQQIPNISTLTQDSKIITLTDQSGGRVLLVFRNEVNATQARVKIDGFRDLGELVQPADDFEPIITFTNNVTDYENEIPYGGDITSLDGNRRYLIGSEISLSDYSNKITKTILNNIIISKIEDYEGNLIDIFPNNSLIIKGEEGDVYNSIENPGEYYVFFDIQDSSGNKVDNSVNIKINIVN